MSGRYLFRLTPTPPAAVRPSRRRKRDLLDDLSSPAESSGCWTLTPFDCCQVEGDAAPAAAKDATVAGFERPPPHLPSPVGWSSTDRLVIQSVKCFILAGCLFRLIGSGDGLLSPTFRPLLAYPSEAHSQIRLMIAACVTLRVFSTHCPSVRFYLSPIPRLELRSEF